MGPESCPTCFIAVQGVTKMKRVFFMLYSMNLGGVEKAFLGLLSTMPQEEYEVHVGLIHNKGQLLRQLPLTAHIHEIKVYQQNWQIINNPPLWGIKVLAKKGHLWEAFVHLLLYVHFKLTGSRYWFYRYLLRNEPMMAESFDVAVAFAGPSQMIDYYVCKKVDAKEKWGWIHFDVSQFGIDRGMTARLYKHYQHIYIVSKSAKQVFDAMFPQFSGKTEIRYNIVDRTAVLQLAETGPTFTDNYEGTRILTVGRVSEEKGQRLALETLRILKDEGRDVRWYFVGEGRDLDYCKKRAAELRLQGDAVFLGLQTNPYGFMRDCDIYVQPSLHEGFCITLAEALCFDKPIVATDFTGAREQLEGNPASRVVAVSAESIAEGIRQFL